MVSVKFLKSFVCMYFVIKAQIRRLESSLKFRGWEGIWEERESSLGRFGGGGSESNSTRRATLGPSNRGPGARMVHHVFRTRWFSRFVFSSLDMRLLRGVRLCRVVVKLDVFIINKALTQHSSRFVSLPSGSPVNEHSLSSAAGITCVACANLVSNSPSFP